VWRHIAQSVQGHRHLAEETACQDQCAVRVFGSGEQASLVAIVADGAGSAEYSEVGSRLACTSVMNCAALHAATGRSVAQLAFEDILRWCEIARAEIEATAAAAQRDVRDYATTLFAALVSKQGSLFFQIGDGAIVLHQRTTLGVVFWPQSGEYFNSTNFLTGKDFRDRIQFWSTDCGFADVALFTDGLERLALRFDALTAHPPFFVPLFQALRNAADVEALAGDLRHFLQSDSLRDRTDDDKTLVLASWLD
jgi:hypothetical protein